MMSDSQLTLDLRPRAVDDGKKTPRLTCTCSDDLKEFVEKIAGVRKTSTSELMFEYVLDGIKNDITNIFLPAPHLDKSLREILSKKF